MKHDGVVLLPVAAPLVRGADGIDASKMMMTTPAMPLQVVTAQSMLSRLYARWQVGDLAWFISSEGLLFNERRVNIRGPCWMDRGLGFCFGNTVCCLLGATIHGPKQS